MTDLLLTWGCSYLLHSSLLIGGLWGAERAGWLARLSGTTQETLWRLALLGGLASASLPLLHGLPALRDLAGARPAAVAQDLAPRAVVAEDAAALTPAAVDEPRAAVANAPRAQVGALALPRLQAQAHDGAIGCLLVWLAGAVLMLGVLALRWAALRRRVSRLPELAMPRWHALVGELARDARVSPPRLRHAPARWASPLLAPGRQLCLPAWCLDLPDDEARAVLGHELAHLRRRDPAWRLLAAGVKALLWPQPLNHLALQRLDLLAELACDGAAARPAGQRLALAQSLLRCAEALRGPGGVTPGPALACGAAGRGSPLLARVRRLLAPEADLPRERRALRWGLAAGVLGLLVAMPAVVVSHTDARALLDRLDLGGWTAPGGFLNLSGTRMRSTYPGGSFEAHLQGQVTFNADEDDVQALAGQLAVRERQGGVTRELTLSSSGSGAIERDYRVDGQRVALDDAGRRWWAQAARRMAEPMTDPDVRARRLLARGGLDAVLADVERDGEDHDLRRRLEAALRLGQPLPAAAQDRLIAAAARLDGAFELRESLRALAVLPLAEPQQVAWLRAAAKVDGDFERREALAALAPRLAATPAVLQAWQQALAGLGGDFELRTAIQTQVDATPRPAVLAAALQAAGQIHGDFERRQALDAVARHMDRADPALVQGYLQLTGGIGGAFERRQALVTLLDRVTLPSAGMEQLIATAEGMDSGFERLQVLLRVADQLADAPQRSAGLAERLRRAGRGLGDLERGQLERALDRLG